MSHGASSTLCCTTITLGSSGGHPERPWDFRDAPSHAPTGAWAPATLSRPGPLVSRRSGRVPGVLLDLLVRLLVAPGDRVAGDRVELADGTRADPLAVRAEDVVQLPVRRDQATLGQAVHVDDPAAGQRDHRGHRDRALGRTGQRLARLLGQPPRLGDVPEPAAVDLYHVAGQAYSAATLRLDRDQEHTARADRE